MIRINYLIKFVKKELKKEPHYPYLEEIYETLVEMESNINNVDNNLGGLGRLVPEDLQFANSKIGHKLLKFIEEKELI